MKDITLRFIYYTKLGELSQILAAKDGLVVKRHGHY